MSKELRAKLDDACRRGTHIALILADGSRLEGKPLHVGPRSLWMVSGQEDIFPPLSAIVGVEGWNL